MHSKYTRKQRILITAGLLTLAVNGSHSQVGLAQNHDQHAGHGSDYGGALSVSPTARSQIDAARAAILQNYDTPEKAEAGGWRRPRSSTPTMGEHWTNPRLMADATLDPRQPEILMFTPIEGQLTLVGASWVNRQPPEAPLPQLFDGLDGMWHRHDASDPLNQARAAIAARSGGNSRREAAGIVMNHVWFVDAQDGEFTGHNHWLPFMDAGLPVPPAGIRGELLAQAALALGEVNGSAMIIDSYYQMLTPGAQREVDGLRSDIEALIPAYAASHTASDIPTMTSVLGEMGALWSDIRAVHSRDLPPDVARLAEIAYGNMASGHEHAPGISADHH